MTPNDDHAQDFEEVVGNSGDLERPAVDRRG
jgi:hypothetical protein